MPILLLLLLLNLLQNAMPNLSCISRFHLQDSAFQICAQVTWHSPNQGMCSTYSAPFPFGALLTPPPQAPTLNHIYKGELATCGGE
jgi:hypothetical protein